MIILILAIVVVLIIIVVLYNSLVSKKNMVDNAFYSIDVMLKKRYELVPQLVETVKGYMNHEKNLLLQLTEARQKIFNQATTVNDKVQLDNEVSGILQHIIVAVEAYPVLKASETFLKLQGALNETEEQLAASRRFYNAAVNDFNNAIEMFPSNIIASSMGLKQKTFFAIQEKEKAVPQISIN